MTDGVRDGLTFTTEEKCASTLPLHYCGQDASFSCVLRTFPAQHLEVTQLHCHFTHVHPPWAGPLFWVVAEPFPVKWKRFFLRLLIGQCAFMLRRCTATSCSGEHVTSPDSPHMRLNVDKIVLVLHGVFFIDIKPKKWGFKNTHICVYQA